MDATPTVRINRARGFAAVATLAIVCVTSLFIHTNRADALLGGFIQPLANPQIRLQWESGLDCTFTSALKSAGQKDRWRGLAYYNCSGPVPQKLWIEAATRAGTFLQEYGPRTFGQWLGQRNAAVISQPYGPGVGINYNPGGLYPPVADTVWKIKNTFSFPALGLPSLFCWWPGHVGGELNCVTQSTVDGK
jgi:hypothetical protein